MIGRTNCGKSTLINKLVGREACPVGDFNDATMKTSIHAVQKGNVIYEFVDLPGVPDVISPCGVGEYTFRRRNIEKAKANPHGNHSIKARLENYFYIHAQFRMKNFALFTLIRLKLFLQNS